VAEEQAVCIGERIRLPLSDTASQGLAEARATHLQVGIRPEHIRPFSPGKDPPDRAVRCRIVLTEPLGHETLTHLAVGSDRIVARGREPFTADGQDETSLWLDTGQLQFFNAGGERIETGGRERAATD
jgi:ABC-type sugar transport system ATPase subunit